MNGTIRKEKTFIILDSLFSCTFPMSSVTTFYWFYFLISGIYLLSGTKIFFSTCFEFYFKFFKKFIFEVWMNHRWYTNGWYACFPRNYCFKIQLALRSHNLQTLALYNRNIHQSFSHLLYVPCICKEYRDYIAYVSIVKKIIQCFKILHDERKAGKQLMPLNLH